MAISLKSGDWGNEPQGTSVVSQAVVTTSPATMIEAIMMKAKTFR